MLSAVTMLPPSGLGFAAPISAIKPSPLVGASINMAVGAPGVETPPPPPFSPEKFAKTLSGISGPVGYFDPLGFCSGDATEGKIRFYREVEVKHARLAMLAAVGFPIAETIHFPWINVPSYIAFQQSPLQPIWWAVLIGIGMAEIFTVIPKFMDPAVATWAIKPKHFAGDFGWDPLELKPPTEKGLKEMQTKELNNGRLAMIAIVGMVGQELATGQKLF